MRKMDKSTLQHLCELSKLSFDEAEQDKIIEEMSDIIALMDQVRYWDEGCDSTRPHNATPYSELRKDKARQSAYAEGLLQNADGDGACTLPKITG